MGYSKLSLSHHGETLKIAFYHRAGTGVPILFLHGLGASQRHFAGAHAFAAWKHRPLLSFDFPGHGDSTYTRTHPLSVDDLVDIVAAFLNACRIDEVVLIGHSLGGLVGLRYADVYPHRVHAFINVEGNLTAEDCGFVSRRTLAYTLPQFQKTGLASIAKMLGRLPYPGCIDYAHSLPFNVLPRAFHGYCPSLVALSDSGTLLPTFERLPCPRLFVHGDAYDQLSYLGTLRQSGITVAAIPQSHHFPFLDQPKRFYDTVQVFLASLVVEA